VVIEGRRLVHYPDRVLELFPGDRDVVAAKAVSYLGVPLFDLDGKVLGHLAVLDDEPMPGAPRLYALFRLFAARAAAEVRRIRRDQAIQAHERKLRALVDGALDAIVEFQAVAAASGLRLTRVNPAAEKLLAAGAAQLVGADLDRYLQQPDRDKLRRLIADLGERPEGESFLWVPGGLAGRTDQGRAFQAEASLSRYQVDGQVFHGLILRDVNDRLEAERRIRSLETETEVLRGELRELLQSGAILGRSPKLMAALADVAQVAPTDAAVMILGETGTGKEAFARAVHTASARRDRPFVKVNCAAIPATLIESELFGHEKGAFTGATGRRDGRFALADGGTIFLDEVGELPLDLQPKLLRVVQEGEFEPVGSSRTRRVDVRVVSATHRDLDRMVQEGGFREDLYYRLNVFPIHVPPLRERGEDVGILAQAFVERFAGKLGRVIRTPPAEVARRLRGYDWPGNVRELQNVIERAVITARDGHLDLDRALPGTAPRAAAAEAIASVAGAPADGAAAEVAVLTVREMEGLERANLLRALAAAGWKVAGPSGAAALLGMKPSTLSSRMKALGLERPR
jgi:PAS domain S-box-containing protein